MQVVILCGGKGTRLMQLTADTPKSMIRVKGKPFLHHQIKLLRKNGIRDIVLCVSYLAEQIMEYFGDGSHLGVDLKYSVEDTPLGTGGALIKAGHLLRDEFFVMYGDSYLPVDFGEVMSFFKKHEKLGLMVVFKNNGQYEKSNISIDGIFIKEYNKINPKNMVYIDYGLSILKKEALNSFPKDKVISFEEEIRQKLIEQKQLLAFEVNERFYEIGSPKGLEEFRKYIR